MANNKNVTSVDKALSKAFQSDTRPFKAAEIDTVAHDLEPTPFFGISENEVIYFADKYPTIYTRDMIINGKTQKTKEYVIPVVRSNGGVEEDSIFSLNFLNRRDVKGKFLYSIADEGGVRARVNKLCAMGAIVGGAPVEFDAPVFTKTGDREWVDVVDSDGKTYRQPKIDRKSYTPIVQYTPNAQN